MLGTSCNQKNCPGWLSAILLGAAAYIVVGVMFVSEVMAQDVASESEVVVTFERELPFKTKVFTKTFEDKDAFEMWLMARLESKGCDPYLNNMKIDFKPKKSMYDFPVKEKS